MGSSGKTASIIFVKSDEVFVQMETETYPFSACLSDAGGAAGLFLGLSIAGILGSNTQKPIILNYIIERLNEAVLRPPDGAFKISAN